MVILPYWRGIGTGRRSQKRGCHQVSFSRCKRQKLPFEPSFFSYVKAAKFATFELKSSCLEMFWGEEKLFGCSSCRSHFYFKATTLESNGCRKCLRLFSVMLNPSKQLTCENLVRILRGHVWKAAWSTSRSTIINQVVSGGSGWVSISEGNRITTAFFSKAKTISAYVPGVRRKGAQKNMSLKRNGLIAA